MILGAKFKAKKADIRLQRQTNWELAALIMRGFHDPKKFPRLEDVVGNEKKAGPPTEAEITANKHRMQMLALLTKGNL